MHWIRKYWRSLARYSFSKQSTSIGHWMIYPISSWNQPVWIFWSRIKLCILEVQIYDGQTSVMENMPEALFKISVDFVIKTYQILICFTNFSLLSVDFSHCRPVILYFYVYELKRRKVTSKFQCFIEFVISWNFILQTELVNFDPELKFVH